MSLSYSYGVQVRGTDQKKTIATEQKHDSGHKAFRSFFLRLSHCDFDYGRITRQDSDEWFVPCETLRKNIR
jgi:hypothetical protein